MVEMYYKLVLAGKRTCNEENSDITLVPKIHRAAVIKMLEENGYDKDGKVIN